MPSGGHDDGMEVTQVWSAVVDRLRPGAPLGEVGVPAEVLWGALALGLLAVALRPLWRVLRVGVTVVHELGHAVVGVLAGRRFTGLVLRPDMSGHAVTVGPSRGTGRVVTTWAGYPAPALVGAALVLAGSAGWAAPVLLTTVVLLLVGLLRARSGYTVLVMLATAAGTGWLWWSGGDELQGLVLLAVGVLLLLGAWRHLAAVGRTRGSGSDPEVLARLTRVPTALWMVTFALVHAAASWVVADRLADLLVR